MQTKFWVYQPTGEIEEKLADMPEDPGFGRLDAIIRPLLNGADLEHVSVLHDGRRADMFVDDMGVLKKLQRNEAATKIYRANWLAHHPDANPENLSAIYGPAVLFERLVWF